MPTTQCWSAKTRMRYQAAPRTRCFAVEPEAAFRVEKPGGPCLLEINLAALADVWKLRGALSRLPSRTRACGEFVLNASDGPGRLRSFHLTQMRPQQLKNKRCLFARVEAKHVAALAIRAADVAHAEHGRLESLENLRDAA